MTDVVVVLVTLLPSDLTSMTSMTEWAQAQRSAEGQRYGRERGDMTGTRRCTVQYTCTPATYIHPRAGVFATSR
jgi:hypothetical protein